jgi:hypothetical protein
LAKVWENFNADKYAISETDLDENSDRYLSISHASTIQEDDTFDFTYRRSLVSNITGITHFAKSSQHEISESEHGLGMS